MMVAGTEIKITPEGVFITTPNIFKVKASKHIFEGGDSVPVTIPMLMKSYQTQYQLLDEKTNKPLSHYAYEIHIANGRKMVGITDEDGLTRKVFTPKATDTALFTKKEQAYTLEEWYFAGDDTQPRIFKDYIDDESE